MEKIKQEIFKIIFERELNNHMDDSDYAAKEYDRQKTYNNKWKKLWPKIPLKEHLRYSNEVSDDEKKIITAIFEPTTITGSIAAKWLSQGVNGWSSEKIVELYEMLRKRIFNEFLVDGLGENVVVDEWLQMLDVELDYSNSKRISNLKQQLEELRKEGMPINHQINLGAILIENETGYEYMYGNNNTSAVPNDDIDISEHKEFFTLEQYLASLENLITEFLSELKAKGENAVENTVKLAEIKKILDDCSSTHAVEEIPDYFRELSEITDAFVDKQKQCISEMIHWENTFFMIGEELYELSKYHSNEETESDILINDKYKEIIDMVDELVY